MGEPDAFEEVDAVPVIPVLAREPGRGLIRATAPTTQAMVAAGGFVAGAALVGLAGRRRARRLRTPSRGRRGTPKRAQELVRIVGTRSLLVDVHLLDGR